MPKEPVWLKAEPAAEEIGVEPATLRRWLRETRETSDPLPHRRQPGRGTLEFVPEQVKEWMQRNRVTGRPGRRKKNPGSNAAGEPLDAKERKLHYDAEISKLKALRLKGELLDAKAVERGRIARIAAVRNGLLALPQKHGSRLYAASSQGQRELERVLLDLVRELLEEFARGEHDGPDAGSGGDGENGAPGASGRDEETGAA